MTEKLNDTELKKSLAKGLRGLYIVEGNEEFLVRACADTVLKSAGETAEVLKMDVLKAADDDLKEPFYSFSLSGDRRFLVLEGFDFKALKEERLALLSELVSDIPEGLTVIIKRFVDDERFSPSKKLAQLAEAAGDAAIVNAGSKGSSKTVSYVMAQIKRQGCTASPETARLISERCGEDLMLASGEVAKLAAYCRYGEITTKAVETLCIKTPEYGVYDMLGSLERGDTRRAFSALNEMLEERTEPLLISAVLNTAFINLLRCKLARAGGLSEAKLASMFDYRPGDKKLSIAFKNCGRYSLGQLEEIIDRLYSLDTELKSSAADKKIVLLRRVAEIASLLGARA
ncbi:MAG: DNA polymerase III subunit delta [Oscillospiraceae bacterium]|nr:DNA polymerase III subunit delta [Oscillospiraceae bacterium]